MFLGQNINLTPLGGGFNAWFPLFILIPVIFTLFSLYDKIKGVLGLGDFGGWIIEDDDDEDGEDVDEEDDDGDDDDEDDDNEDDDDRITEEDDELITTTAEEDPVFA